MHSMAKLLLVLFVMIMVQMLVINKVNGRFMAFGDFVRTNETKQGHLFNSHTCAMGYIYIRRKCVAIFGAS